MQFFGVLYLIFLFTASSHCLMYEDPEMSDDELEDYFYSNDFQYVVYVIPYHQKLCYYEESKATGILKFQGDVNIYLKLNLLTQATGDGSEIVKLTIKLPGSSTLEVIDLDKFDSDLKYLNITTPGEVEYCFDNLKGREEVKVWFSLNLPQIEETAVSHKALSQARKLASKYREMTNSIYRWSHQTERHSRHIQKRKKSVIYSSFFICVVILFTGALQVVLIRALFNKYR